MIKPKNFFFIIIEFQTFYFYSLRYSYCVTCHSSITLEHSHAHFNISSRIHKIFIANKSLQCMIFLLDFLSCLFLASRTIFIFLIFFLRVRLCREKILFHRMTMKVHVGNVKKDFFESERG